MRTILGILLIALITLSLGCNKNAPDDACIEFLNAFKKNDKDKVLSLLYPSDRKSFQDINREIDGILVKYPNLNKKLNLSNLFDLGVRDLKDKKFKVTKSTYYSDGKADIEVAVFTLSTAHNPDKILLRALKSSITDTWVIALGLHDNSATRIREIIPQAIVQDFLDCLSEGNQDKCLESIVSNKKKSMADDIKKNGNRFKNRYFTARNKTYKPDITYVEVMPRDKDAKGIDIKLINIDGIWQIDLDRLPFPG
jgi:hypothetical protein